MARWLWVAVIMIGSSLPAQGATIVNGSFETGDLTGWFASIPAGAVTGEGRCIPGSLCPQGAVEIVQHMDYVTLVDDTYVSSALLPVDGDNFVAVGTGNDYFSNADIVTIEARQTMILAAGDLVSGWAALYNGDYTAQDSAWVKLFNELGIEVATPWFEHSGDSDHGAPAEYLAATGWVQWTWTAPVGGTYTLSLGVSTFGDNRFSTWGLHDSIQLSSGSDNLIAIAEPAVVAEPATLWTLLVGVAGLVVRNHSRPARLGRQGH